MSCGASRSGPFNNIYGMGASPIIVDDLVVLACDQSTGSFIAAFEKKTGKERWRTPRPEARSGHSTPIVYAPRAGPKQILLPGSFLLNAYTADTGKRLWWVGGLSFELKSVPVSKATRSTSTASGRARTSPAAGSR